MYYFIMYEEKFNEGFIDTLYSFKILDDKDLSWYVIIIISNYMFSMTEDLNLKKY